MAGSRMRTLQVGLCSKYGLSSHTMALITSRMRTFRSAKQKPHLLRHEGPLQFLLIRGISLATLKDFPQSVFHLGQQLGEHELRHCAEKRRRTT